VDGRSPQWRRVFWAFAAQVQTQSPASTQSPIVLWISSLASG